MDGGPQVDEQIVLPTSAGGTVFRARAWGSAAGSAVVVVAELPDNPGTSVSLNFEAVASAVRPQLPAYTQEVFWVELWQGRSLAAYVLGEPIVTAHHLRWLHDGCWWRRPLSTAATRQLLSLVAGDSAARIYSGQ